MISAWVHLLKGLSEPLSVDETQSFICWKLILTTTSTLQTLSKFKSILLKTWGSDKALFSSFWAGHRDGAIGAFRTPESYTDGTKFLSGDFRSADFPHSSTRSRYGDRHYFNNRRASEACPTQLTYTNTVSESAIDYLSVSTSSYNSPKMGFSCGCKFVWWGKLFDHWKSFCYSQEKVPRL